MVIQAADTISGLPHINLCNLVVVILADEIVDARTIDSLRSTVGQNLRVFNSEIPYSVRAAECSNEGKSIFAHDKNGRVAQGYDALAQEVIQIERTEKHRPRSDWVR